MYSWENWGEKKEKKKEITVKKKEICGKLKGSWNPQRSYQNINYTSYGYPNVNRVIMEVTKKDKGNSIDIF